MWAAAWGAGTAPFRSPASYEARLFRFAFPPAVKGPPSPPLVGGPVFLGEGAIKTPLGGARRWLDILLFCTGGNPRESPALPAFHKCSGNTGKVIHPRGVNLFKQPGIWGPSCVMGSNCGWCRIAFGFSSNLAVPTSEAFLLQTESKEGAVAS